MSLVLLVYQDAMDKVALAVYKVDPVEQDHKVPKADLDRLALAWTRLICRGMLSNRVTSGDDKTFQNTKKACDK